MDIYRQFILDHYKHPRNYGSLTKWSHRAQASNATCGDRIVMEILINAKKEIADIRFSGVGCAISQASASLLSEKVKGQNSMKVMQYTTNDILKLLGMTLTPSRIKCASLALEVLKKALAQKQP